MENKISMLRKQLKYIESLYDILTELDDGGFYRGFSEDKEKFFDSMIEFTIDQKKEKEEELKKIEEKLLTKK